jgi:hypothetical protein
MGFGRVSIDYETLGHWMFESEDLAAALGAHAETGVAFAKSIAPVGPPRDPHRGEFRDSIHAEVSRGTRGGVAARIVAGPLWPEFGRRWTNPYAGSDTLRRTRQYLNSPKRSA